jgi:hypothetical protein
MARGKGLLALLVRVGFRFHVDKGVYMKHIIKVVFAALVLVSTGAALANPHDGGGVRAACAKCK